MGKTFKDKYRDDDHDQKTYRIIKMKKIKGWSKPQKESSLDKDQSS